jgi:hypothetical protein
MTVEQATAIIASLTTLVVAVTALAVAIRSFVLHINSRLDQLLELTRTAAIAEGRKLERDLTHDVGSSTA